MDASQPPPAGLFEARYLAFLETIGHLRPKLHRYCARMVGSVLDGEDIVQDTLFQAYRKLDSYDDGQPLAPWLFRIAHNQSIDFCDAAASVARLRLRPLPPIVLHLPTRSRRALAERSNISSCSCRRKSARACC